MRPPATLLIATSALFALAAPRAASAKDLSLSLTRVYTASAQVPDGWSGTNEDNTLFVTAPDKSVTVSVSFDTSPDDLQKSPEDLFEVFRKTMNLQPPTKQAATLSGLAGTAFLSSTTRNNVVLDFRLVVVRVDPAVIAIEYSIVRGKAAAVQNAARSVEQTIKLKAPE